MATIARGWRYIDKGEIRDLAIAVLALAFAFSWRFAGPATFGNWAGNFILVLLLVLVSVIVHEIVHRLVALKFQARVRSKLFMSSVVAMLLLTIVTNGWLVFAVPWAVSIIPLYFYRPGKPFPKWHLGPKETAVIAVAGPLTNFAIAVIARLLVPSLGLVAEKLMVINISLAFFNMLPFLTAIPIMFTKMTPYIGIRVTDMPYVEGEFVFFGSRSFWAFTFAFVVIGGLSLFVLDALASILIAFMLAAGLWVAWHFFAEEPKEKGQPFRFMPPKPI